MLFLFYKQSTSFLELHALNTGVFGLTGVMYDLKTLFDLEHR